MHIGAGARSVLPGIIAALGARRAVLVSARPDEWNPETGVETLVLPARDGEPDKTLAAVGGLCSRFARFGLTRDDVVVSVGGGTTTDTVGLAASLFHRGVPVIHVPTTLLAQVDASIGGKTAVNLPEGKNLVGAYWQPKAVLCDTDYLGTLPRREWTNGYGEIARCMFIGTGDLRGLPVSEQIAASVARKAEIVVADERDAGLRHLLNYGHTLGHALERATDYALRHGEGGDRHGVRRAARRCTGPDRRRTRRRAPGGRRALRPAHRAAGVAGHRRGDHPDATGQEGDPRAVLRTGRPAGAELVGDVEESLVATTLAGMPRQSHDLA